MKIRQISTVIEALLSGSPVAWGVLIAILGVFAYLCFVSANSEGCTVSGEEFKDLCLDALKNEGIESRVDPDFENTFAILVGSEEKELSLSGFYYSYNDEEAVQQVVEKSKEMTQTAI